MKVTRLPVDPGPAAWSEILNPVPVRAPLAEDCTADWIIIGAGFAGLSAAQRLSELCPNANIVVLEASRVAYGPAGRNSGFMIDLPHDLSSKNYSGDTDKDRLEIRLNRAGIAYAKSLCARFGASDEAFTLSGKINGAITSRGVHHNDAYARCLDALHEPYERLGAGRMRELTGTESYIDGLFTPGTAMIQPAAYLRSLADGIESNAVRLYELSPVVELNRVGSSWQARTSKGTVTAAKVILCVNGHLQSFGFQQRKLMHVFTYASMTRRMNAQEIMTLAGKRNWGITPADPLGTTVRRISGDGGDRIIIRNRATFDSSMVVDDTRLKAVAKQHAKSFKNRFPMLPKLDMEYCWGGRLCLSRNNVPVFGEIDNGVYSACCQNGLGTVKGTIAGKLAAELACGVPSELLDHMNSVAETKALPPEPLATLGATAMLRWGEFKAGQEL